MQYQVSLGKKLEDGGRVTFGALHTLPWDLRDLIELSSGWTIVNHQRADFASELVPKLEKGIMELSNRREAYSFFQVKHGMDTIDDTVNFFHGLLGDCKDYPFAELYGEVITEGK